MDNFFIKPSKNTWVSVYKGSLCITSRALFFDFGKPLLVDPKVFFHVNDDGFVVIGDGFPQGPLPFKPAQGDLVVNHDLYVAGSIWSPALSELQTTVSEIKETNMKLLVTIWQVKLIREQLTAQKNSL